MLKRKLNFQQFFGSVDLEINQNYIIINQPTLISSLRHGDYGMRNLLRHWTEEVPLRNVYINQKRSQGSSQRPKKLSEHPGLGLDL